jgi:hypothetical protein
VEPGSRTVFAKAPTLAWLLTALSCFLAGMAVEAGPRAAEGPPIFLPRAAVSGAATEPPVTTTTPSSAAPTAAPTATPCDPAGVGAPRFGCTGNVR